MTPYYHFLRLTVNTDILNIMENSREKLRYWLFKNRCTVRDFANKMGVNACYIHMIISAKRPVISPELIGRISKETLGEVVMKDRMRRKALKVNYRSHSRFNPFMIVRRPSEIPKHRYGPHCRYRLLKEKI